MSGGGVMNCEECGEVMILHVYIDSDGYEVFEFRCPGCGHCMFGHKDRC